MPLINRVGGGSAELQSKTVKSTTSQQTIEPDEGYDGISEITVSPIKLQSRTGTNAITPSASTQNITPSSLYDGLSKVEIKPIPSSYVQPNTTQGTKEWTPTTYDQTISAGTYCSGKQTIKGDADLVAGNIKSGVNIFGVTGTFSGGKTYYGTTVGSLYDIDDAVENLIKIPIDSQYMNVKPTTVTIQRVSSYNGGSEKVICVSYYNNKCYGISSHPNNPNNILSEGLLEEMLFYWSENNLYIEYPGLIANSADYHYIVSYN